jgi:hypothetical protein
MRHFTLAAFAVATLYVVGGCGNGNKVSLDGGGDMGGGGSDFATGGGGDMTAAKASACGSIYDCLGQGKSLATCEAKSPTASKQKFADFLGCMQNTCGVMGTDAGATAPCMVAGDLGVDECNQCFTNVIADCSGPPNCTAATPTFFVDMNQMPVKCATDGTPVQGTNPASDCGKCIEAATACIFECYTDVDCAMLQHSDGTPATCDTTTNQCM